MHIRLLVSSLRSSGRCGTFLQERGMFRATIRRSCIIWLVIYAFYSFEIMCCLAVLDTAILDSIGHRLFFTWCIEGMTNIKQVLFLCLIWSVGFRCMVGIGKLQITLRWWVLGFSGQRVTCLIMSCLENRIPRSYDDMKRSL